MSTGAGARLLTRICERCCAQCRLRRVDIGRRRRLRHAHEHHLFRPSSSPPTRSPQNAYQVRNTPRKQAYDHLSHLYNYIEFHIQMGSNECGWCDDQRRVREVVVCVCENVCVCGWGIVFSADTQEMCARRPRASPPRRRIVDVAAGDALLDVSGTLIESLRLRRPQCVANARPSSKPVHSSWRWVRMTMRPMASGSNSHSRRESVRRRAPNAARVRAAPNRRANVQRLLRSRAPMAGVGHATRLRSSR